ncbi:hypothetical protein PA598K_04951 [Paenibacillus sp. 598K]|nr:hypothetical protein PA598K_04951 [Paenibacillus sp. 598K]
MHEVHRLLSPSFIRVPPPTKGKVWDGDRLEDYGGPLDRHSKYTVRITEMYYVSSQYQFYIRRDG